MASQKKSSLGAAKCPDIENQHALDKIRVPQADLDMNGDCLAEAMEFDFHFGENSGSEEKRKSFLYQADVEGNLNKPVPDGIWSWISCPAKTVPIFQNNCHHHTPKSQ